MSILDARAALQQGRIEDAIGAYRAELAREPRVVETWQELGGGIETGGTRGRSKGDLSNHPAAHAKFFGILAHRPHGKI